MDVLHDFRSICGEREFLLPLCFLTQDHAEVEEGGGGALKVGRRLLHVLTSDWSDDDDWFSITEGLVIVRTLVRSSVPLNLKLWSICGL